MVMMFKFQPLDRSNCSMQQEKEGEGREGGDDRVEGEGEGGERGDDGVEGEEEGGVGRGSLKILIIFSVWIDKIILANRNPF